MVIRREVINWPEQHYENGVAKNDRTSRSFKALVRILKSLRNEMDDNKVQAAGPIIGFLSECLIWNVPETTFRTPRTAAISRQR